MPCGCESGLSATTVIAILGLVFVVIGLGYVIVRFLKNYKEETM